MQRHLDAFLHYLIVVQKRLQQNCCDHTYIILHHIPSKTIGSTQLQMASCWEHQLQWREDRCADFITHPYFEMSSLAETVQDRGWEIVSAAVARKYIYTHRYTRASAHLHIPFLFWDFPKCSLFRCCTLSCKIEQTLHLSTQTQMSIWPEN